MNSVNEIGCHARHPPAAEFNEEDFRETNHSVVHRLYLGFISSKDCSDLVKFARPAVCTLHVRARQLKRLKRH
eukprot:scaffold432316_cov51-Prasinocladus_malaysianus.AAC.1